MNYQYSAMHAPIERYTDGGQQIDTMRPFEEYSNLRDMWKLKIMNAQ